MGARLPVIVYFYNFSHAWLLLEVVFAKCLLLARITLANARACGGKRSLTFAKTIRYFICCPNRHNGRSNQNLMERRYKKQQFKSSIVGKITPKIKNRFRNATSLTFTGNSIEKQIDLLKRRGRNIGQLDASIHGLLVMHITNDERANQIREFAIGHKQCLLTNIRVSSGRT